jgi:hypothetical protein
MILDAGCPVSSIEHPGSSIKYRDTLDKSADQYYSISGLTGNEKGIALVKTSYRGLQDYVCRKTKHIN